MANEEHIKMLKQGVRSWNRWRNQSASVNPDLWGANLNDTDLREVNLRSADLRGAQFINANLSRADFNLANLAHADFTNADLTDTFLMNANLRRANLNHAILNQASLMDVNLTNAVLSNAEIKAANFEDAYLINTKIVNSTLEHANLKGAHLSRANLSGANLIEADLYAANLSGALLSNVDLSKAIVGLTIFGETDLSTVRGLETVVHRRPSTIGIDTIYLSRGNIPDIFLIRAGVPDKLITYLPSLIVQPICFISHSSKDEQFCDHLLGDLQSSHIKTWYFPEDAQWGESVWKEIDMNIKVCDKLIVVCSQNSLKSGPVLREIERALNREDREGKSILFPVRIDDYVFDNWEHERKDDLLKKVVGDFSDWDNPKKYKKSFRKLITALKV